ncbi:MAG: hypothetical protein ACOYMF_14870 [Bacteroidales bacterium]
MRPRSIPPITSTGTNRRKTAARLDGLAHMSIGRYMSMRRNSDEDESWNITKHVKPDFNKKSKKKISKPIIYDTERKFHCIIDVIDDYNGEGDFGIIMEFNGFKFLDSRFNRTDCGNNSPSYIIAVNYRENETYLYLTTNGGMFEYGINNTLDDCIYCDDFSIPKLPQEYDSSSMTATLRNNFVIVAYKKINL